MEYVLFEWWSCEWWEHLWCESLDGGISPVLWMTTWSALTSTFLSQISAKECGRTGKTIFKHSFKVAQFKLITELD